MILFCTTMSLPAGMPPTFSPSNPEPNSNPLPSRALSLTSHPPPYEPSSEAQLQSKGSFQLQRWSRARAIRSGRKLDRPNLGITQTVKPNHVQPDDNVQADTVRYDGDEAEATIGKSIYMISDGTGWTVEHSVTAALGQFEHCFVDRGCPVNTHLFSGIEDEELLIEIIKQAAKENATVVYTLADPSMAESARRACELWCLPSTDILGPITEAIASHLGVSPSGLPRGGPGRVLTDEYFRRIEAIEFTIKQDDGALPNNLHKADIVLVGVSRTGKTPLSTYLAQKGYKVANVPIVMGLELPKCLFEVDPQKIFGLTINHVVLRTIRKARAKTLGLGESTGNYSDMDYVRQELEFARKIYARHPVWPVIEVTGKAVEETAAVVLRLYHDKQRKCSMPRISKRY